MSIIVPSVPCTPPPPHLSSRVPVTCRGSGGGNSTCSAWTNRNIVVVVIHLFLKNKIYNVYIYKNIYNIIYNMQWAPTLWWAPKLWRVVDFLVVFPSKMKISKIFLD
jgi:hypothetical protein